jgi:predicted dehydrogenase
MSHNRSRRQFLAGAIAFPMVLSARAKGANDRIIIGHVGLGGQGLSNLKAFAKNAGYLCDVDATHLAVAAKLATVAGVNCPTFGDYRKLLDRKDVDAVVVATPDHWHALVTIDACKAGKDVYCEKPLSLTVAEGRAMVDAARANKRVVQTGSQQRSWPEFRLACDLVRAGKIGKVAAVWVGLPATNFASPAVPDSEPPAELDYDFWLGPAPKRPYNAKRVHYNFRFFWDYSGGQMTNFGAHHIDIAQWALGRDESGPVSTAGTATFDPKGEYEVTTSCQVEHTYDDGVKLLVGQLGRIKEGVTFVGEDNKRRLFVGRGVLQATPQDLIEMPTKEAMFPISNAHQANFLDCVKSRDRPIADVAIGHRSATVCHLGNIAIRLGRKITWDPKAETIVGDDAAKAMLSRPYRAPWAI